MAQFDIVAGARVIAYMGYLARQYCVYRGTGFCREVDAAVKLGGSLPERIPAMTEV